MQSLNEATDFRVGQRVLANVRVEQGEARQLAGAILAIDSPHPYPVRVRLDEDNGEVLLLAREIVTTLPASRSVEDIEAWLCE